MLGALSLFLLDGWDALFAVIAAPAIVGACLGLCAESPREATSTGILSAALATLLSVLLYPSIPAFASQPTVARALAGGRVWLVVVLTLVIVPLVAWSVAALLGARAQDDLARRAVAWTCVALIALSFVGTMAGPVERAARSAYAEPAAGAYRTDQTLNLKTYYLMSRGATFYDAYVQAHADDGRGLYPVRDGRFPTGSAAMFRQPTMFALWRTVSPDGGFRRIAYLSVLLCSMLLCATFWGLHAAVGDRALFICIFVFPLFVTHANGSNLLLPEWWALLALLCGFLALVRGRPLAAGVFGLVALTFRETFGVWLLALCIAAAIVALRDRRAWLWVAFYAGLLAAGTAIFLVHVSEATRYVITPTNSSVFTYLLQAGRGSALQRLDAPLEYLTVAYGNSLGSPMWLVPAGLVGLWVGLRSLTPARLASLVYATVFLGYFATLGVLGPYWGQALTPMLVVGTGLLLASLDRLLVRDTWRFVPGDATWGG